MVFLILKRLLTHACIWIFPQKGPPVFKIKIHIKFHNFAGVAPRKVKLVFPSQHIFSTHLPSISTPYWDYRTKMCEICFNRSNWPKRAPRGIKYMTDPQYFLNLNIFSEHTCPLYSTLITLYRFYKREICICRITWRHVTFYIIGCKKILKMFY